MGVVMDLLSMQVTPTHPLMYQAEWTTKRWPLDGAAGVGLHVKHGGESLRVAVPVPYRPSENDLLKARSVLNEWLWEQVPLG